MSFFAKKLYIKKFRKIEDQELTLGRRINVISGQNSIGKSNMMALIAANFGTKTKRFSSGNFHPLFDDFFTISENESYKDYETHLEIGHDNSNVIISKRQSFKNDTKGNRAIRLIPRNSTYFYNDEYTVKEVNEFIKEKYNIGPDARIPIPTIISTLSRLYPVGETTITKKVMRKENNLKVKDKFIEYYNFVLPNSIDYKAESIKLMEKSVTKKNNIYTDLKFGNEETQSVGQDSLGNIVTALTDFYNLKISDPKGYQGGILCIDELDSSLHPSAQVNILDLLKEASNELNLQIFITTHSLTILKKIIDMENENSNDYRLAYLIDYNNPRFQKYNDYISLKADLFDKINVYKPLPKIYCEDDFTYFIFKTLAATVKDILKKDFPKYEIIPIHLGCDNLKELPKKDSYFGQVIIVLDGDSRTKNKCNFLHKYINNNSIGCQSQKINKNFIYLPKFLAPESYIYLLLNDICKNKKYRNYWNNLSHTNFNILTSSKLENNFLNKINITENTSNNDIKDIISNFKNETQIDLKELITETQLFNFYYEHNIEELEKFYSYTKEAIEKTSKYIKSKNY